MLEDEQILKCINPKCDNNRHPSYGNKCEDCWVEDQGDGEGSNSHVQQP